MAAGSPEVSGTCDSRWQIALVLGYLSWFLFLGFGLFELDLSCQLSSIKSIIVTLNDAHFSQESHSMGLHQLLELEVPSF